MSFAPSFPFTYQHRVDSSTFGSSDIQPAENQEDETLRKIQKMRRPLPLPCVAQTKEDPPTLTGIIQISEPPTRPSSTEHRKDTLRLVQSVDQPLPPVISKGQTMGTPSTTPKMIPSSDQPNPRPLCPDLINFKTTVQPQDRKLSVRNQPEDAPFQESQMKSEFPLNEIEEMRRLYSLGIPIPEIAKYLKTTPIFVYRSLDQYFQRILTRY